MAATAIRGIVGFVVSVVLVIGALWLVPGPAHAVEPPPPPVPEYPALPSTQAKALTGSPLANQTIAAMKAFIMGGGLESATTAAPKVLSGPQLVARGAAGSMIIPFYIGYTLGQGGLEVYAYATGTSRDSLICNQSPEWFQASSAFISAGLVGGCQGAIATADQNPDAQTAPTLTYGGLSVTHSGRSAANSSLGGAAGIPLNQPYVWCYSGTVTLPAGTELQQKWSGTNYPGDLWKGVTLFTSSAGQYGCGSSLLQGDGAANGPNGAGALSSTLRLRNTSTGAVLANMVAGSGNPTRQLRCTITWADGTMTTGTGLTYNEGAGLPVSTEGTGCKNAETAKTGTGTAPRPLPDRIKVDSDNGGAITTIADTDVPTFSPTETQNLQTQVQRGLVLEKVVNGVTSSCMTWEADCAGWWTSTSNGTSTTTSTGTYRCTYNNAAVALAECGIYRNTFDTRTSTPTLTEPGTGEQVTWIPGTANPGPYPSTVAGASPADSCYSSWPAAPDPITWVQYPIRCELVRAFVPRQSVVTSVGVAISTAWANTWPAGAMASMSAIFATVPSATGCAGPRVQFSLDWPAPIDFDAEPLNACNPPVSILAWFARVIGAISIMFATAWGVTRRVGAIVNAKGVGPG